MSEILFCLPNSISDEDKAALREASIIVIECDDPTAMRFTRATPYLESDSLLAAAAKAMRHSAFVEQKFGEAVARLLASLAEGDK